MPPGKFSGATPRDLVLSPENPQFFIPHIRQPRPPRVSARALLFFSDAAATRFATTSQARRVLRGLGERTAFARPSPDILLERFGGHPGPPKLGRPMQTPRVCMADRRGLLPRLRAAPKSRRPSWPAEALSADANAKGLHGRPTRPPALPAMHRCNAAGRRHAQESVYFACTARRTMAMEAATAKSADDEHVSDRRRLLNRFARHPGPPKRHGATQPVGGTRRSRCTLPAPQDAPWR